MANTDVYLHVIGDIINSVRGEFIADNGPGEGVLAELQALWESKLMQVVGLLRTSAPWGVAPNGTIPIDDLNFPYEGAEEFESPTIELLFPPTPDQAPLPADGSIYNVHYGIGGYLNPYDIGATVDIKVERPTNFMEPPLPWLNQRPRLGVDVNVGGEGVVGGFSPSPTQDFFPYDSAKRRRDAQYHETAQIPQQDGAGDVKPDRIQLELFESQYANANGRVMCVQTQGSFPMIPQVNEYYNVAHTPAGIASEVCDEEQLNEDDDDLDEVGAGENQEPSNLIVAVFKKVTRAKNRWKCLLKAGLVLLNDREILFNKACGEFEF